MLKNEVEGIILRKFVSGVSTCVVIFELIRSSSELMCYGKVAIITMIA